jgi:hypothetical protein
VRSPAAAIVRTARELVAPPSDDLGRQLGKLVGPELGQYMGFELDLRVAPGLRADLEVLHVVCNRVGDGVTSLRSRLERL